VTIVNALQLEAACAKPALSRFNYDPCPVWRRWTYLLPYYNSVFAADNYFTPWPWPLTFDLKHLQRIVCDVMKFCTKFERNRTIGGGVIAISVFDLMTLNMF